MRLEMHGAVGRAVASPAGTAVARRVLPPLDGLVHRLSRGRHTVTAYLLPTLVLTTTGRVSAKPRPQPLCFLRDGDAFLVVGTNWGGSEHPAWTGNLVAQPRAEVAVDGRTLDVLAEEVTGPDRDSWYRRFEALAPNYSAYPGRTGGRVPRMFRLRPAPSAEG